MGATGIVRWLADVRVSLRPGIADPQGQTIASGLRSLGFSSVGDVRAGKLLRIGFEAPDHVAAERTVDEMCRRLLANPVMETATWDLRADEQQSSEEGLP
jgi:phosphoribosylformylglycinamidine synthase